MLVSHGRKTKYVGNPSCCFFRLSTSKPQTFISNLDLRISVSAYDWVTCSRQQLSQCETFNLHAIRSYDACTCRDWQQIFLSLKSLKWLNSFSVRFHMWGEGVNTRAGLEFDDTGNKHHRQVQILLFAWFLDATATWRNKQTGGEKWSKKSSNLIINPGGQNCGPQI